MHKTKTLQGGLLALALIGNSARISKADSTLAFVFDESSPGQAMIEDAAGSDASSFMPVADVVTPAVAGLNAVPGVHIRSAAVDVGPASVLGGPGGTELFGGLVGFGLLFRYVRRRRLI